MYKRQIKTYNSKLPRNVEVNDEDSFLENAIFTCYFVNKKDPLHGITRLSGDINYMRPWYESINRLSINGIVFHDGLENDFIEKYQTQFVRFRKCQLGDYSIFEERWIVFYMFLSKTNIQRAFFCDIQAVSYTHLTLPTKRIV